MAADKMVAVHKVAVDSAVVADNAVAVELLAPALQQAQLLRKLLHYLQLMLPKL